MPPGSSSIRAAAVTRYFLIENRWPGSSYDRALPDQGLAVWHIMENPDTFNAARPPATSRIPEWSTLGPTAWARKGIRMIRPNPSTALRRRPRLVGRLRPGDRL